MRKSDSILDTLSPAERSAIVDRIKYLRTDILDMTQSQFAQNVNISQTYLSLMENGNRELNVSALLQIASSFRLNLDWLIYGIGNDDNIFENSNITKDDFINSNHHSVLTDLKKTYSLKDSELEFIKKFLSLSSKEKHSFINAINLLSDVWK